MKITLMFENEEKTFTAGRPKGRMVRRAIRLAGSLKPESITEDTLDELIDYVVDVYGKQFTIDDFYDGLYYDEMMDKITETIEAIANGTAGRLGKSKNGQAGKAKESC
ncbi:Uncharacterised protein [Acetobacterium wieringae]|uniref:phage tail assembly chaperone G n=1 Tax=Acetobacterium wieringae TaxID=52694 RepID=UPI001D354B47|nr:hypothetical protein [Acetobacterium wieringae]VUZ24349.1 Uncharacterised protein [Acetobacterium wieringae]